MKFAELTMPIYYTITASSPNLQELDSLESLGTHLQEEGSRPRGLGQFLRIK